MNVHTDYIKLDSFLKFVNAACSGGEAKIVITGGNVRVNGEIEIRRGRKLYKGDVVELRGARYDVAQELAQAEQ